MPGRREPRRGRYGAGPAHLVLLAASFTVAAVAIAGWFGPGQDTVHIVAWFLGAVVVHDFILLPIYSLVDRRVLRGGSRQGRPAPPWTPFVRVPALLSGLLLLVFFPFILGWGSSAYRQASGMTSDAFLGRWATASAALFALSACSYLFSRIRHRHRHPAPPR